MLAILKFILHVGQKLSNSNLYFIYFAKQETQNICSYTIIVTGLPITSAQSPHLRNDIWVFVCLSRSAILIFEWIELSRIDWFSVFRTDWFQSFLDVGWPSGIFLCVLLIFWRPITPLDSNWTVSQIWQFHQNEHSSY